MSDTGVMDIDTDSMSHPSIINKDVEEKNNESSIIPPPSASSSSSSTEKADEFSDDEDDDDTPSNFFSWRRFFIGRREQKQLNYPSIDYSGESFIRLPSPLSSITSLSEAELIDKIKGAVFGQCLGDAFGVHTEFMSKESAYRSFPYGNIPYGAPIRGWAGGDWTDDSDQMILILDSLLAHGGKINESDFSNRLSYWVDNGFSELGDSYGNGCGGVVSSAVRHELFLSNPRKAAREVYERSGGWAAANGAVMRTSILGIPNFHSLPSVIERTKSISECTHADPRCTASSILCTTFIAMALQGKYKPTPIIPDSAKTIDHNSSSSTTPISSPSSSFDSQQPAINESIEFLLNESLRYAEEELDRAMADEKVRNKTKRLEMIEKRKKKRAKKEQENKEEKENDVKEINGDEGIDEDSDIDSWGLNEKGEKERIIDRFNRWKEELRYYCSAKKIDDLKLDEPRKIGYTYKCIASGVWTVKQSFDNIKLLLTKLVMEGGDADTNGAVAGAMLGAIIGYSKLPKDWIMMMPHKEWLEKRLNRLITYMGLNPDANSTINNSTSNNTTTNNNTDNNNSVVDSK